MQDSHGQAVDTSEQAETFVEGLDFYFDEGLMVLTRRYLLNRGHCCNNICRHCPYGNSDELE
ncbi:MAG: DUF5522 domain-containing protein [Pyrinomonadaceae bacterium]|nr:DUF5522 domain-containing protein [Pyrinomonadaceae bacterium]